MKRFKVRQIYLLFILILSGFLITGCGGSGGVTETGHWLPKDVISIEVTPPNPIIATASPQQFMATGIYAENAHFDLTSSVTWSSSDTNIATISNAPGSKGLATSKAVGGKITITATDPATGKSGYTTLTVKPPVVTLLTIEVTPPDQIIALGTNQRFIAMGIYSDGTKQNLTQSVIWSSSNTAIATINTVPGIDKGLAHAVTAGKITITATDPATEKYGYTTLTVKPAAVTLLTIEVTPPDQIIALGTNQRFIATGIYSDGSTQNLTSSAAWSSSNTAIATINTVPGIDKGLAHAVTAGKITITATDPATEKYGYTTLTVKPAAVTPMSIEVTPTYAIIPLGLKQQFIAMVTYTDGTKQNLTSSVTWSTPLLATPIASISNAADGSNGLATSLHVGGPIEIKATVPYTDPVISGTAQLRVTEATLVSIEVIPADARIPVGATKPFIAMGIYTDGTKQPLTTSVTWSTPLLTTPVASISNAEGSEGLATALTVGGPIRIHVIDPTTLKFGNAKLTVTAASPPGPGPAGAVDLLTATPYGITAYDAITNSTGPSHIYGDVGLTQPTSTSSSVTGPGFFDGLLPVPNKTSSGVTNSTGVWPGLVNTTDNGNSAALPQLLVDLKAVYADLMARAAPTTPLTTPASAAAVGVSGGTFTAPATDLSGFVLRPGIYTATGPYGLSNTSGPLVLDAEGNPDAVFIIRSTADASGLTSTSGSIVLQGGAQAKNIFWVVANATIGVSTFFQGTVVAGHVITLNGFVNVEGRMLAGAQGLVSGAITLTSTNVITVPE